jgi:hypothetical protein
MTVCRLPFGSETTSWAPPFRSVRKTISRPLGAQEGSSLVRPWSWVTRLMTPVSGETVNTSKTLRSSRAVKAIESPRGLQVGVWL